MGCLCCGAALEVGALCRACAQQVAPCDGLIADHLRSTTAGTDADAWLVDGFGHAHAVAAKTTIGRSADGGLLILAASVSREHAELKLVEDGAWQLRDLGSRNGSFVDNNRAQGRVVLPPRCIIKIGDVAMWFLAEAAYEPALSASAPTASVAGALVRFAIQAGSVELCLVGSTDATSGGALLSRSPGQQSWKESALPPLEFQLMRALCTRAHDEADSPAAARGCVGTKQLARDLPFQSKYANEENVRQVVRRLRGALAEVGADGVLAVVPGRGYYIAAPVKANASADR